MSGRPRVLGYLHTFNDAEVVDRCIDHVLVQSSPVDEVLIVDNASTDGSVDRDFPHPVTVLRHEHNLGTNGAVATGLRYALEHDYDWMWILDADSCPRADALQVLLDHFQSLSGGEQASVGMLSSAASIVPHRSNTHATKPGDDAPRLSCHRLTRRGPVSLKVPADQRVYETETAIWSGSLYRMNAVRIVGLPRFGTLGYWDDFNLDWGDAEYSNRLHRAGFRLIVHRNSVVEHPLGSEVQARLFGRLIPSTNYPPFRRYLDYRNGVYFWLHIYPNASYPWVAWFWIRRLTGTMIKILLLEQRPWPKIRACLRGVWDGLRKNLHPPRDPYPAPANDNQ